MRPTAAPVFLVATTPPEGIGRSSRWITSPFFLQAPGNSARGVCDREFFERTRLCRKKCAPTGLQIASQAGGHTWWGRIDPRSSNLPPTSSAAGVLCGRCIQFSRRPCGRRDRDRSGRVARRAAAGRERSERSAFGARPISRAPSVSGVRSGRASSFSRAAAVDVLDVLQPARERSTSPVRSPVTPSEARRSTPARVRAQRPASPRILAPDDAAVTTLLPGSSSLLCRCALVWSTSRSAEQILPARARAIVLLRSVSRNPREILLCVRVCLCVSVRAGLGCPQ